MAGGSIVSVRGWLLVLEAAVLAVSIALISLETNLGLAGVYGAGARSEPEVAVVVVVVARDRAEPCAVVAVAIRPRLRRGYPVFLELFGVRSHEWAPLMQIQVQDMVDVRADRYLVLGVVLVERAAIATDHRLSDSFALEEFPAVVLLLKVLGVESVLDLF